VDFPRISAFLASLAANNEKAWFEANRSEYQALRDDYTAFVARIIASIAEWDETVRWVDPKDCIYRIHRDVRFSGDKTPYKTTFSAVISQHGRHGGQGPSYYFQVDEKGMLMAGGGVWMPPNDRLALIREHAAEHPERFGKILRGRTFKRTFGGLWDGHKLKRPPAGYPADHPLIEILKLKSFLVERERDVGRPADDVEPWIVETFRAMHPFILWLRDAVARAPEPRP
jgi:uncharacterized protein (TIGR02453 family)